MVGAPSAMKAIRQSFRRRCPALAAVVANVRTPAQRAARDRRSARMLDQVLAVVQHEQQARRAGLEHCIIGADRAPPEGRALCHCSGDHADRRVGASSTNQAPSRYVSHSTPATSNAKRVLPTPPAPTIVSRCVVAGSWDTASSSTSRRSAPAGSAAGFRNVRNCAAREVGCQRK